MKKIIFLIYFVFTGTYLQATHLRAGQISVLQMEGTTKCIITLTIFTNTSSSVLVGGLANEFDILNFGDGTTHFVTEQQNVARPDLGPNVGIVVYTVEHTYPSNGSYLIGYTEPNRNEGILNMTNSTNTAFYIETLITLMPGRVYSTPSFLLQPILQANLNDNGYTEALAATDVNGYQLFYYLQAPKQSSDQDVDGYQFPENISMDPINGLLEWDTKYKNTSVVGEFVFSVKVYQVYDDQIIGYVLRDFQLILNEGSQDGPSMSGGRHSNGRINISEQETSVLRAEAISPTNDEITLQVVSELDQHPDNFSYTITDSLAGISQYKVAKISVLNNSDIIRDSPYIIIVRATDSQYQKKDVAYVIATRDIVYKEPLILSTEENLENDISLFPNPAHDFLYVENKTEGYINITIQDASGKIIERRSLKNSSPINLDGYKNGVYLLSIQGESKSKTYRIVKE